jgi:5-methylcytosine-specific restriction endonuclease McrA
MSDRSHQKYGNTMKSRAQAYGVDYEPVNRLKVFERDGWRCGICGIPVDKTLRDRNPMMASLDHIMPMALGGGHTYINTQCSHLRCNIKKGHRITGDQLALIG